MKSKATAAAQAPTKGKQHKVIAKQVVKKEIKVSPKTIEDDANALSATDLEIINKIDERLHDLYYLNDEENYLGI